MLNLQISIFYYLLHFIIIAMIRKLPFILIILLYRLAIFSGYGQVIEANIDFPKQTDAVVVTFYADRGDRGLMGYSADVYAHTGVITSNSVSPSDWKYVKTNWGENTAETKLTRISANEYQLTISPDVISWYGVPAGETVLELAFVFRNADGSRTGRDTDGSDIFLELHQDGFAVRITSPLSETIIKAGSEINIGATASETADLRLYINEIEVASVSAGDISYDHIADVTGHNWIWVMADDGNTIVYDSVWYFAMGDVTVAELPEGVVPGANYTDPGSAVVVLHDPPGLKEFVFLIGDLNEWLPHEDYLMNRTAAGDFYWISVTDLEPGREYAYQFFIDGALKIADPYTHKVLDPWHDQYVSPLTYPDLKPYPEGKTTGIVSILQTDQPEYEWEVTNFTPPDVGDLVIYEMLIRDFVADRDIKTITDSLDYLVRLGINAIELMPVNQFEGNDSWGYNPSFYFATDKAYGRKNDYKRFIDECHKRGIAVILDMVLNHSYGQSPMVQMYFDSQAGTYGQPSADNPWYNQTCPHPPFCWGFDFDHESPYTREFIDRVNKFWVEEFRIDGFRFDFTKGFTNNQTGNQGSDYDAARVAILKRMADKIWETSSQTYIILEHFADNTEETLLADYGMLLWGNLNYNYNEATMGYIQGSNFSGVSYKSRGWDVPHLIGYMESHDEERLMFKNIQFGNSADGYNTRLTETALRRMELAAVFYFPVPGPKMIWQFGEVGYDYSINHCPDGTINENCRTSAKPVRWDYYEDWRRRRLFDIYAMLIELKITQPVFATEDFSTSLSGAMKRIHLNHPENNVTILGNFGVLEGVITPHFQQTGTWYEFFTGESIEISDVNSPINLKPGEYRLYSTAEFPAHGIPLTSIVPSIADDLEVLVFPNPARGEFFINFNLDIQQHVKINIYNTSGQKIAILINQLLSPGSYNLPWNRNSFSGNGAGEGVLIVEIIAGESKSLKRVVIY
jgi:glycosidase